MHLAYYYLWHLSAAEVALITSTSGWEADIVSGASVSSKAGPAYAATHPAADVISTASVSDFRNVGKGGFTVKHDNTQFGAGGRAQSGAN